MKKFTFKGVLDGFRSSVQAAPRGTEQEIQETLRSDHFQIKKTFRHGFPFSPTAIAWDPIQKLLAIGDKAGNLRILGGPGVDAHVRHESGEAVLHARFLINDGALVTATADDQIHLWNFRQKLPQVIQSLKFQRERITCLHLPLQSKWLHVGTERGNVHVVHVESFTLSGYVINWNKAIELTRQNHPGAVVHIGDNPLDASKLSIAFESGLAVVWDLKAKAPEWRGSLGGGGEGVRAAAWQNDGKLMTAHADGALATWTTRAPRPHSLSYPHAKSNRDGKLEPCKPIHGLEWKTSKTGESFVIFSGGLPTDRAGRTHSITVLNGKSTTVLEMEHSVVDFITLCESPWTADYQEPYAIVVLLQNDLVVIDLLSPGYPCFENPYPMDIHESPVTCCSYFADCPSDLIPAFYSVGRQGNKKPTGFSDKLWPIDGGEWAPASCSYSEIILTGHADGSVKFWDASAGTLQILYKLKCSKVFERRPSSGSFSGSEDTPLGIQQVALCAESRRLAAALPAGHVLLFKFRKQETFSETHVIDIPVISEGAEEEISPDADDSDRRCASTVRGPVGSGGVRKAAGFQVTLACLQRGATHPPTALCLHSAYGLMAWGGERGLVVVDVARRCVVLALSAASLYGPADRTPSGPSDRTPVGPSDKTPRTDRQRSPSLDQLESSARSPPDAAEFAARSLPDDRRKSASRRTFDLKRRLSRVDLKLKAAFADADDKKCQFYCETPTSPETEEEESPSDDRTGRRESRERWNERDEEPVPPPRTRRTTAVRDLRSSTGRQGAGLVRRLRSLVARLCAVDDPPEERVVVETRIEPPIPQSLVSVDHSHIMQPNDKLDSSFSRSRSSSMSSLENISQEGIQCLAFADSYTRRSDPTALTPALWVGTTLGSVLTMTINLPDQESRHTQPLTITNSGGPVFRLKGSILTMSFLDCNGALIPYSYESWKDDTRETKERRERTPTKQCSNAGSRMSPTPAECSGDRQFVVIVSEKQARVVALPSQNCVYRQQIVDTEFVVKAEIVSLKDSVCVVNYLSTGHIVAYSLPSLRPLVDVHFLPLSELSFQTQSKQRGIVDPMLSIWGQQLIVNEDTDQIAKTFCFSNKGQGLYLASPAEIQKFTIDAEFCQQLNEMLGELFLPRDMPEPPKESFFRGLFGGGSRPLDREELFGEGSGKASRTVARHIPGPGGLEALGGRASTAASEISRAHLLVQERGEKLGQLEDRTERMHNQAGEFSTSAHQLMLKYKDKKWYQL